MSAYLFVPAPCQPDCAFAGVRDSIKHIRRGGLVTGKRDSRQLRRTSAIAMETLLNLIWLLLALTTATLWIAHWRHAIFARGRRRQVLYSAVGLMCVLLLMFYAISLTDDLLEITALGEDAALVSARASKLSIQQHRLVDPQAVAGILASSPTSAPARVFVGMIPVKKVMVVGRIARGFLDLRGPPIEPL